MLLASTTFSWAYDFYAVAPSGQTLYYNIVNGVAQVTYQNTPENNTTSSYTNLTGALTIPESVTYNGTTYSVASIGYKAFYHCTGLTSVTIPNSVTLIGNAGFSSCWYLTSVTIGGSVTSIGNYAFGACGLISVTIPNSVTSIGEGAFYFCSNLTSVTIPNSVTSISHSAFYGCSNLTSVTIPDSVTIIGYCAFRDCSSLTTVNFNATNCTMGVLIDPDNNLYTVFHGCTNLTTLNIGANVTNISAYAFKGCSGLTGTLNIPNSVTSIGDYAFYDCIGLTGTLNIPNSVTSIGKYAFSGCIGLTGTLNIPNSVTNIGEAAFSACRGLSSVTIPNSVTNIKKYAFINCNGLTSATIGNTVDSIGGYAFGNCGSLHNFICKTVYPPIADSTTFAGIFRYCTLTVPCGSLIYYNITEPWNTQLPLMEEDCGTEGIDEADGQAVVIYAAEGSIHIDAAQPAEANIYDMMGRRLATVATGASTSTPMPTGIYLVKVGTLPARKVVVM